ncbi:MAG: HAMP domain-containing sensor histidine kinase [Campylobacterota bacterium]|nr:HAMP domain-containing sensor histidine kinase [Campylobacterota bacterium]
MRFKSLKTTVLVWFGSITFIILMLFNVAIYHFIKENTKLNIQNNFYNKAVYFNKKVISGTPITELIKEKELENVDIAIFKEDKMVFRHGQTNFVQFQKLIAKNESFYVFSREDKLDGLYILKVYTPYKGAILFYEQNIDERIEDKTQEIISILLVLEPLLLFLLIFLASKMINKILRSIKKITDTANKIYVSDLSQEIPQPKYDDEVKALVDSFNNMLDRLRNGVEVLEQFNSDVSHELKTPLTVIKGEIEITLNKQRDSKYYTKSLQTIDNEATQIQMIVDDLLLLTKYTKENIEQTFELIHLDSLLLETINKFNQQLKMKNIKLDIKELQTIEVDANPVLIATIFSNLIDNAIKYSLADTHISVSLYKDEQIHFVIQDQGIGIAQEQLEKITDRFYRVDSSRNKKIKGFGLGLSIVKNSVKLHDGSIKIDSKQDIGTKIEVVL